MGKLYWKRKRFTSSSKDEYADITNWRFIRYKEDNHRMEGCLMMVKDLSKHPGGYRSERRYFIVGADINHIIQISNSTNIVLETFFTEKYERIPLCQKCGGSGKHDWINKATKSIIYDFIRDPKYILTYEPNYKKPSFDSTVYNSSYLFLARTTINESNSESYCKDCLGTGLHLDGRHGDFMGFNNFKHNLVVKEWNLKI